MWTEATIDATYPIDTYMTTAEFRAALERRSEARTIAILQAKTDETWGEARHRSELAELDASLAGIEALSEPIILTSLDDKAEAAWTSRLARTRIIDLVLAAAVALTLVLVAIAIVTA